MGKLVTISTPLTQEVAIFVSMLQSKGSAVRRIDDPPAFRQAVRAEARRRRVRVRTGVASHDANTVWAVALDWKLLDDEYERASRQAANKFDALLRGSVPPLDGQ